MVWGFNLHFYYFKIIRYPQVPAVILFAFLRIHLLSVCKVSVFRMIQEQILNLQSLCQFTGILYRGMMLFIWIENIRGAIIPVVISS